MLRNCVSIAQRVTRGQSGGVQAVQRRTFAAGAGEEQKVNMWEAPTQFSKWKTEHLVLTIMAGYGLAYVGVKSYFSGGAPAEETPKAEA
ncbi:hypothetical protein BSKO_06144 [Bryopsis sp. KO-2023]|nr:hypothetical protein BSKO_06144 [Bryopsis sp. KO-2023]